MSEPAAILNGEQASRGADPAVRLGGAQAPTDGPFDYIFSLETSVEAEPALTLLLSGYWAPGRIRVTFRPAQFAAFKKGLEKVGIELRGVTRVPHLDPEPVL